MTRLGWVATSRLFSRAILLCMGLFSRFCVWPLQGIRICCAGADGESIQLQPISFSTRPHGEERALARVSNHESIAVAILRDAADAAPQSVRIFRQRAFAMTVMA